MSSSSGLSDSLFEFCGSPSSPPDHRPGISADPTSAGSLPSGLRDLATYENQDSRDNCLRQRVHYSELEGAVTALDVGIFDAPTNGDSPTHRDDEHFADESGGADDTDSPSISIELADEGFSSDDDDIPEPTFPQEEVDSAAFNELFAVVVPTTAEDGATNMLTHASITACLEFKCDCLVPCTIRAGLDPLYVHKLRADSLQHSLNNGSRTEHVANMLRSSLSMIASHHPAETERGNRVPGQRARRQHYVLNNVDVCPAVFALAIGVSPSLLRQGTTRAKNLSKPTINHPNSGFLNEAIELNSDVDTLFVVEFIIRYANDSGAEKIPMDEDLERASRFQKVHGGIDGLSLLRLHECTIEGVYAKYLEWSDSGRRYSTVNMKKFRNIFQKDKRLLHICLARPIEGFSICTSCQEYKLKLYGRRLTTEQRLATQHAWSLHLHLVWKERLVYVSKAHAPYLEKIESIPPRIRIKIALSIHIDKQTKNVTVCFRTFCVNFFVSAGCPSLHPIPKCANSGDRLFYNLTSVVVNGVGYFIFLSTDAQSSGCELTMEVLYRLLITLQSHGYVFDSKFYIQADNHTDNKTPAVLFFLAYLVSLGAFHTCILAFLLVGHGHLCADQKHSINARALRSPSELPIVPSRFRQALRNGFKEDSAKPTIVEIGGVHQWSNYLRPFMEAVDLGRLACSAGSGDAQYEYSIRRTGNEQHQVGLTYKKYASEAEVYPRAWNVGAVYISEAHGPGCIASTTFCAATNTWTSEVQYHNGYSENISDPPQPIHLFPGSAVPLGSPIFEGMASGWGDRVRAIKANIRRCEEHLTVFRNAGGIPGVEDEWRAFFESEEAQVAACLSNPAVPWCREPESAVSIVPTTEPYEHVEFQQRAPIPPPPTPFPVDPVTHLQYTAADRAALQRAERVSLAAGTLVLVKLKYGTTVPAHHKLPFCLAFIPEAPFDASTQPGDEPFSFPALFARGNDMATATWTNRVDGSEVRANFRSILVSGVHLTAARKLNAASTKKLMAMVSSYDLEL